MHASLIKLKPLGFGWGIAGLASYTHLVVAEPSSTFVAFVAVHLVAVFLDDHLVSVVAVVVVAGLVGTPVGCPHTGTPARCS